MCLPYFVKYSSLNMVRVKGLRTLPVSGLTSTDVLLKYEMVDVLQPRARHFLGELKVDL